MKLYHWDVYSIYRRHHDIQGYFESIRKSVKPDDRILVTFAGQNPNQDLWLDKEDVINILNLSGFEAFGQRGNKIVAKLLEKKAPEIKPGVSIIIPARNEEGNIKNIVNSIPQFGSYQEIIFVEGGSSDNTWAEIEEELERNKKDKTRKLIAIKQKGKGKADAMWKGLKSANGKMLMTYDADRTIMPKDLIKFYNVLVSGLGDFANGDRLIYPMENDAMRQLNKIGNKVIGWLFTKILGQRFKDTLCGTKAFWMRDFKKFKQSKTDPFGDFNLIFGAVRNNLKIVDVPVQYKERVYGSTNINRFYHGLLLLKMTFLALKEFRF